MSVNQANWRQAKLVGWNTTDATHSECLFAWADSENRRNWDGAGMHQDKNGMLTNMRNADAMGVSSVKWLFEARFSGRSNCDLTRGNDGELVEVHEFLEGNL